jgi:type 1 fimbria pilin
MHFTSAFGLVLATALVAAHAHAQSGTIQFSGAVVDPGCSLTTGDVPNGTVPSSSSTTHLIINCARPASFNAALVDLKGIHVRRLPSHEYGYGVTTIRLPDTNGSQNMMVIVSYM